MTARTQSGTTRSEEVIRKHREYLWQPAPEALAQLLERTRENGLLIGKGGLYGNVVRLSPMLNISRADVDEAVRLLDKSFGESRI